MVKATWNGVVIAESDNTVVVEGNHYFPAEDVNAKLLVDSDHTTRCAWKGLASYKHVVAEGKTNDNAVWYYKEPFAAASQIKDRYAFWRGVQVS
jgi:uncharacterized protein (DUF427 family)